MDGLVLTLVNVQTGKSFPVRTGADGSFEALVPAGSYVVSSPGRAGVSISRAPLSIEVATGRTASAAIEVAAMAMQAATASITHDAADCVSFDQFTLIEAVFAPLTSVVNGRLYFQSNLSPEWFYTQFEKIEPAVPGGPTHRAFIPKVTKGGGITDITYYLQITSTDFAETKSPEKKVVVVENQGSCKGKLAPIGNPSGPVSVLSASGPTGALAGFGGIAGGTAIGAGTFALILGAAGAGTGAVLAATGGDSTPTPTPVPTATPTSTPAPTPTPVPQCSVTVTVSPANRTTGANWGIPGDHPNGPDTPGLKDGTVEFGWKQFYCSVYLTAGGSTFQIPGGPTTITYPCTTTVTLEGDQAPVTSKIGPRGANWQSTTGSCSGSALANRCILPSSPTSVSRDLRLRLRTRDGRRAPVRVYFETRRLDEAWVGPARPARAGRGRS